MLKILAYLFRSCVFQLGMYQSGLWAKVIVKLIKNRYDIPYRHLSLTSANLNDFIDRLEDLGGRRAFKTTVDGNAKIDYMILAFDRVKERIEQKGGKWVEIAIVPNKDASNYKAADPSDKSPPHYIRAIYSDHESPEWTAFFKNTLNHFEWEEAVIAFPDSKKSAYITFYSPSKPPETTRACFLRCHSPGRSYGMDESYIGKHLSLNQDLCLFNYRGTHQSTGVPSEGGYYLDTETLYQELISTHSYQPEQIWVTGFSLGGAVAGYLKAKYHDQGINYVGENTFSSLEDIVAFQPWPINILGKRIFHAICSTEPSIQEMTEEDYFNNLKKFSNLKSGVKNSISIIINTDHDPIVPENSADLLYSTMKKCGNAFKITHKSVSKSNPHGDDLYNDAKVWQEYASIILNKLC
jgi:alpha/beta superfamily hydrolase